MQSDINGRQDAGDIAATVADRGAGSAATAATSVAAPADAELARLRTELRQQLALQGKNSLYSTLGVTADCSDAEIAAAIARTAAATSLDPEQRYAVEILGDAGRREAFDRRLREQLRPRAPSADMPSATPAAASIGPFKWLATVALVLGLGYLGLSYVREHTERELRLREAALREEAVRKATTLAERMTEHQERLLDATMTAQERAAAAQEQALLEARMREDKARLDQAYRQEQQTALAEQRRQQAELSRVQAERRRTDAEAAAALRVLRQQAIQDAVARGNYNEAERLRNQN